MRRQWKVIVSVVALMLCVLCVSNSMLEAKAVEKQKDLAGPVVKQVSLNADQETKELKTGGYMQMDVMLQAPEKMGIEEVDLIFKSENGKIEITSYVLEETFYPGVEGDVLSFDWRLGQYELTEEYQLDTIKVYTVVTISPEEFIYEFSAFTYTRKESNLFEGIEKKTGKKVGEFQYDGGADFSVIKGQMSDNDAPLITSVKRLTTGKITPDSTVQYEVGFTEKTSRVDELILMFENEANKEVFEYHCKSNENEFNKTDTMELESSQRNIGTYTLTKMSIKDYMDNTTIYELVDGVYKYRVDGVEKTLQLEAEDTAYTVELTDYEGLKIQSVKSTEISALQNVVAGKAFTMEVLVKNDSEKTLKLSPAKCQMKWIGESVGANTVAWGSGTDFLMSPGETKNLIFEVTVSPYANVENKGTFWGVSLNQQNDGSFQIQYCVDEYLGGKLVGRAEKDGKETVVDFVEVEPLDYTVKESEFADGEAPVLKKISLITDKITAPGWIDFKVELDDEGNAALNAVSLCLQDDAYEKNKILTDDCETKLTKIEDGYVFSVKLKKDVICGNYIVKEIELTDVAGQKRNYKDVETDNVKVIDSDTMDTDFDAPVLKFVRDRIMNSPDYAGDRFAFDINVEEVSGLSEVILILKSGKEYIYARTYTLEAEEDGEYSCSFYIDQYAKGGKYNIYKMILIDDSAHKNMSSYIYEVEKDSLVNEEDGKKVTAYLDIDIEQSRDWIITSTDSKTFEDDWNALDNKGVIVVKGTKLPADFLAYAKEKNATVIVTDEGGVAEFEFKAADLTANALEKGVELFISREALVKKQLADSDQDAYHLVNVNAKNAQFPMTMRVRTEYEFYLEALSSKINVFQVDKDEYERITKATLMKEDLDSYELFDAHATNVDVKLGNGVKDGESTYAISISEHTHDYKVDNIKTKASFSKNGSIIIKCKTCGYVSSETVKKVSEVKLSYTTIPYNGKVRKPSVTVKDSGGKKLVQDTDYTLTYQTGRKNPGRYSVKITLKGKYTGSKTLYFTVTPKAPENFKAQLYGYDDIKLSWSASYGADGYYVYRVDPNAKNENEQYVQLTRTTKTSYKVSNYKDGVTYKFSIIPYFKNDSDGVRYKGEKTKDVSITTLKKVSGFSVKKKSNTEVEITWDKVTNASGYQVSCSTSKTGTKTIYNTTSRQKTYKPAANTTLYYKVRAYKIVNGAKVYAPWSDVKSFRLGYVSALKNLKVQLADYNDVKLTWSKSTGANLYYVYYKRADMDDFVKLGSTKTTGYTAKNIRAGVKYEFRVLPAYYGDGKVQLKGTAAESNIYTLKKLNKPKVVKNGTNIKVSWENINGENGYQISQSTSKTGTKVIATYTTTTGTNKTVSATKGKKFYYKVRAYKIVNGVKVYAPWSEVVIYTSK